MDAVLGFPYSKRVETIFSVGMIVLSIVLMSIVFYASFHSFVFLPLFQAHFLSGLLAWVSEDCGELHTRIDFGGWRGWKMTMVQC